MLTTYWRKVQLIPQARLQNFGDEGNSRDTVDTNMSVLIRRMEEVRMKERLNTYHYKMEKNGWNYTSKYDDVDNHKMHNFLVTSFQLAHIVCTTVALVFLTGSLSIFLVSFIFSQSIN
ncbi:hypothetical protein AAHA92_12244 [Salvia divinorum]|uniref:Uncharacterized protein n=1 Tax=Salvia divinorum TaxID=28513 RepID=A0ABD1HJL9_SALDI